MQYIGARYVPKFMGLYDATQAYEALCVVDNGMGTSYITKVPTPAGTPLTDTDYYAVYGASSGAIINLQNQIGDLNDLTTTDQDSLVDAINEVDADISALTNIVQKNNRNIVLFTDSYGTTQGGVSPFTDIIENNYISSDDIFRVYAQGSVGIVPNTATPAGLIGFIQATIGSITDADEVTDVVIVLGANDIARANQIDNYFGALIAEVKTDFPHATIKVGFIGQSYNETVANHKIAVESYKKNTAIYGCEYLNNVEWIMYNGKFLQADGVHPNSDGASELAKGVAIAMDTNAYNFIKDGVTESVTVNDFAFNLVCNFNNGLLTIQSAETALQSGTFTTNFDNGDLTNKVIRGSGNTYANVYAQSNDDSNYNLLSTINNGKLYIRGILGSLTITTGRLMFNPTIFSLLSNN